MTLIQFRILVSFIWSCIRIRNANPIKRTQAHAFMLCLLQMAKSYSLIFQNARIKLCVLIVQRGIIFNPYHISNKALIQSRLIAIATNNINHMMNLIQVRSRNQIAQVSRDSTYSSKEIQLKKWRKVKRIRMIKKQSNQTKLSRRRSILEVAKAARIPRVQPRSELNCLQVAISWAKKRIYSATSSWK